MLTLIPAYGRDYRSKKDVIADLNANKDFLAADYTTPWQLWNIKQARDGEQLFVRYATKRKQTTVTIKRGIAR